MTHLLEHSNYKKLELAVLFILVPIILGLNIEAYLKIIMVFLGLGYCIFVSIKLKLITNKELFKIDFKKHIKRIIVSFTGVIIASFLLMYFLHPNDLFVVIKNNPTLWVIVLLFYAMFSVYPQELLYRSFFFNRYKNAFKNMNYFLLINILVFPIAHLFFNNLMVLLVTLIGGILFTLTYHKTKSVLFTSIEHALYGNWLFTIGMGEMLAFPMPS